MWRCSRDGSTSKTMTRELPVSAHSCTSTFMLLHFSYCFLQPIVSKALVSNCKPVRDMLTKRFGERKMYQFQVERDRHHDVSFKMLNSNISQLVSQLDDIRRDPK